MIYLITDTHIGHKAMCSRCGRPENFSSLICRNWEKMVKGNDTVLHLGDVAWGDENLKRILRLPGKKILVKGNHDMHSLEEYMDLGFSFACDSLTMTIAGISILFTHEPDYFHTADINIHGHFHDLHREDFSKLYLPLSLEHMGYKPIAMDIEFLGKLSSWVKKRYIPKVKDIISLRQDYIGEPLDRDIYGRYHGGGDAEGFEFRVSRRKIVSQILNSVEFAECLRIPDCALLCEKFVDGTIGDEDEFRRELSKLLLSRTPFQYNWEKDREQLKFKNDD